MLLITAQVHQFPARIRWEESSTGGAAAALGPFSEGSTNVPGTRSTAFLNGRSVAALQSINSNENRTRRKGDADSGSKSFRSESGKSGET